MKVSGVGRLALRAEGDNWCAYYALPNTMVGSLFLGSIRMALVVENKERKNAFQAMMTEVVAELVEQITGERPKMHVQSAPENERSGSA